MAPNNTLLLRGKDLEQGSIDGLAFHGPHFELSAGRTQGSLESNILAVPEFTDLVASWNCSTPVGGFVELQVKVKKGDAWSQWFSYGKWADNGANTGSIKGQADAVARLEVDWLRVGADSCDAIQFKVQLTRQNPDAASPQVRLIAFTWTPKDLSKAEYKPTELALKVAPRAQLPVPEIGNIICSPTSLATVMAYHGLEQETVTVAAGVKDNGNGIYGNWSYNVAYAAERGFTAWIQICDSLEDVKEYLRQGLPVIASIRIGAKEELTGALSAYSNGHLLVITGLASKDGQEYVLVNDPAANRPEDVPRQYKLDQYLRAWARRLVYILHR